MIGKICENKSIVILALWLISIITSGLLLKGTEHAQSVILIQIICMILSVYYLNKKSD